MKGVIFLSILVACFYQGNLTISKLIDQAQKSAAAGDKQVTAADLEKAISFAEKLPNERVRSEILKRAEKLLKKVDRNHASAARAKKSAARRLVSLARKYEKKGWHDSARELSVLANTLSARSGAKILENLPPKKAPTTLNARQSIEGSTSTSKGKPWRATDEEIRSAELKTQEEDHLVFAKGALKT